MFNESLITAIAQVQMTIGTITGIKAAPANPPDAPSGQWPLSIGFPKDGRYSGGGSAPIFGHHTVVVQIHYPRADLARAYAAVAPYVDFVAGALLADPTLSGTVTTISGEITYTFGAMVWAGVDTIGWEFGVPIKIRYTEEA